MSETKTHSHPTSRPPMELPEIREFGAAKDGVPQTLNQRLFIQFLAFTECLQTQEVIETLKKAAFECVLYSDVNDARGIGLVTVSENPALFAEELRALLLSEPFINLEARPEFTMFGRTYSSGHEQNLEDWLLWKPRRNLSNLSSSWAIWYPLKRKAEFELLSKDEQRGILMEHAKIGMNFGAADFAHDVRLVCHGLDISNNEFVIGLMGQELYPLSKLIQEMRKTQQTAKYIESMGPFFVGKKLFSSVKEK